MPDHPAAKFLARAQQPRFGRGHRDAQALGYFRNRQVIHLPQEKNVPEQWRDAPDLTFSITSATSLSRRVSPPAIWDGSGNSRVPRSFAHRDVVYVNQARTP